MPNYKKYNNVCIKSSQARKQKKQSKKQKGAKGGDGVIIALKYTFHFIFSSEENSKKKFVRWGIKR